MEFTSDFNVYEGLSWCVLWLFSSFISIKGAVVWFSVEVPGTILLLYMCLENPAPPLSEGILPCATPLQCLLKCNCAIRHTVRDRALVSVRFLMWSLDVVSAIENTKELRFEVLEF